MLKVSYSLRKFIAIVLLFLSSSLPSQANQDCIWEARRAGIHLLESSACFGSYIKLDSILNIILETVGEKKGRPQIGVYINCFQIGRNTGGALVSIAYDTLCTMDDDYIFDFYREREELSMKNNYGRNLFDSRSIALDINSSLKDKSSNTGIKIIYNTSVGMAPNWEEIKAAIFYAAKNFKEIETQQVRDTIRYYSNGWYVSLLTLNEQKIDSIIGRPVKSIEAVHKTPQQKTVARKSKTWLIISIVAATILCFLFIYNSKKKAGASNF